LNVTGKRASDRICVTDELCTGELFDFLEASYQYGLGDSETYFGILGLALAGFKDNKVNGTDAMGESIIDWLVQSEALTKENAKFTFVFDGESPSFVIGDNSELIEDSESLPRLKLARDSLYWQQKADKDGQGVTGLKINGVNYELNGEYGYKFDTGYQFIDVPSYCNECEDQDEKPYSY
jgi:hypothetical protein